MTFKKPIRALLLSAGLGTRLRPITITTPKCLVEIDQEPILIRWLKQLEKSGCDEVLINTHYLSEKVNKAVSLWNHGSMKIRTVYEEKLLGTAGSLKQNVDFFKGSIGLLIHADNATNLDLNEFIDAHKRREKNCLLTMLTFKTDNPRNCGVVKTDNQGVLTAFYEKVENPPTNIANGAIFAFEDNFINYFLSLKGEYTDFSSEIIPKLIGKVQTSHENGLLIDIGSIESLKKARAFFTSK